MRILERNYLKSRVLLIIPVLFLLSSVLHSEDNSTTLMKIKEHEKEILRASKLFDINPLYLKSIIYTERTLNYNWEDEALDEIIARSGLNSSIGFCRVKMKTDYWIEFQLNSPQNDFYPGDKYKGILHLSKSPEELIRKLEDGSLSAHFTLLGPMTLKASLENQTRTQSLTTSE